MFAKDKFTTVDILGFDVAAVTMAEVIDLCASRIATGTPLLIGVLNVAKAVNSRRDTELRKSLDKADIIVADGCGIVWLSKLMGCPLPERVAGIDIMYKLIERAHRRHYRVYFLGAHRQVVEAVVEWTNKEYPGVKVAGFRDGYFGRAEDKSVADAIRDSKADILFVAMSSPGKEAFLEKWQSYMDVPVCHGVGGSFDVVAGVTARAPLWMQKYGLEWFYRLLQEPGRMWKRYLVTNSKFLILSVRAVLKARLKKRKI